MTDGMMKRIEAVHAAGVHLGPSDLIRHILKAGLDALGV